MMNRLLTVAAAGVLVAFTGCEKEPAGSTTPSTTSSSTSSTTSDMKDAARDAGKAVKDAARDTGQAIKDTTKDAVQAGKDAMQGAKDKLHDATGWAQTQEGMQNYIETLNEASTVMEGVKDAASASAAAPKIQDYSAKITAQSAALGSLTSDERTKLVAEFKDRLTPAVSRFKAEVNRLATDPGVTPALADSLKNVQVFE